MSQTTSPALVDLRNPENMSAFAYKIKKAFNNNPGMTMTEVQSEIAKALGARSLQAYQNTPVMAEPVAEDNTPYISPMWEAAKTDWYVMRVELSKGKETRYGYLCQMSPDSPYDVHRINSCLCIDMVFFNAKDAAAMTANGSGYNLLPNNLKGKAFQLMPLSEAEPALFAALQMDRYGLNEWLNQFAVDDHSWPECPFFDLDRDTWQQEAAEGNTQGSYTDWLVGQFEQFVDERTPD